MWVLQEGPLLGTQLVLGWTRDQLLVLDQAVLYCCFPRYTPVHQLINNIKIYPACLFVCLSVCPFKSNKRQSGRTDQVQIFEATHMTPREGLWLVEAKQFTRKIIWLNAQIWTKNPRKFEND